MNAQAVSFWFKDHLHYSLYEEVRQYILSLMECLEFKLVNSKAKIQIEFHDLQLSLLEVRVANILDLTRHIAFFLQPISKACCFGHILETFIDLVIFNYILVYNVSNSGKGCLIFFSKMYPL